MSDDFDPYYKWLGISPDERPASHYRLLAIREFEPDPEVIESAADRQMSHVRSFQTGAHSADSQRLLNELSAARLCLLNPAKKALYDGQLQRLLAASKAAEVAKPLPVAIVSAPPSSAIVDKTEALSEIISSSPARRTHPVVEKMQSWQGPVITALVATLIVLGLGVAYRLIVYQEVSVVPKDSATQASSGGSSENRDQAAGEAAGNKVAEPERPKQEKAQVRAPLRDQWIDLLAGVNVERSRIDGDWRRVSDGVTMGRRWGTSRLQVEAGMTTGYEAELVFRRTDGEDSVLLIFPVGTAHCTFYLYDPSKDYYAKSGLGDVDGKGTSKNGTGFRAKFESNRDHDLRLVVRHFTNKWSIQVFLDGDRVVDWDGPQSVLTTPNEWNIPESGAFGLAGFDVAVIFKAFHMRGKPNPDAVPSAPLSATSTDLVPPPAEGTGLPGNVWIRIVNRNSRMGIGVREDKKSPGADVIQWDAGAEWMLRPHGDSWSIQDRNSGLYLAVMKSSREQGAAICVESEGNASSQWIIEPTDPTFWKILNRNSGFALAIPQGQRNRGAVACQWPSWSGSDQQWEFKVEAPGSGAPLIKAPFDAPQAKQYQQRWAQQLGVPLQTTNSIGMKLVLIPPGEFEMGSPTQLIDEELKRPNVEWWYKVRLPREGPRHHVRITQPFYLGVYDVTQDEYERIMGTNPSEFSATGKSKDKVAGQDTNRFPVENVSWDDSADFCRRLSELPAEKAAGRRYQLPTEAQWEYACRAGSTGRFSFSATNGPTSKEHDEHAMEDYGWFGSNSGGMTHPVGLKQANAWGLYDMHGNVWQWCRDGYDNGYYGTSPVDDPSGASNAASHVNRGGSWPYPSRFCRSAFRDGGGPGDRTRGLRVSSVTVDIIGAAGQKRRTAAEDARRMATRPTVGVPEIPDIGLPTPAEARSGSRAPNKPTVVPPLVVDLQDPLAHCSVEMDDLPKGALLLEITKLEGSGAFDKDFTVDKPKPLRPGSPGILALTMKGYSNKVTFPITFAMKAEGKGFDITLKVGPKIVATCKDPPRDIEAAKSELRKNRDQAHDKMERAKGKEKLALTHIFEVCDRALASLQFFSEVNKVKVHFRVCVDTGDQHPTVIATTEGP